MAKRIYRYATHEERVAARKDAMKRFRERKVAAHLAPAPAVTLPERAFDDSPGQPNDRLVKLFAEPLRQALLDTRELLGEALLQISLYQRMEGAHQTPGLDARVQVVEERTLAALSGLSIPHAAPQTRYGVAMKNIHDIFHGADEARPCDCGKGKPSCTCADTRAHPASEATDRDMQEVEKTLARLKGTPTADSVAREIQECGLYHSARHPTKPDEFNLEGVTAIIQRALEASAHLAAAPGVAQGLKQAALWHVDEARICRETEEINRPYPASMYWKALAAQHEQSASKFFGMAKDAITAPAQPDTLIREEWQPIETAPKDGEMFLAVMNRYEENPSDAVIVLGAWDTTLGEMVICSPSGNGFEPNDFFSHWMPLPAAPGKREGA